MKTRVISIVLGLLGLLSIGLLVIAITPLGLPLGLRLVSAIVPGEITIKGPQGRLIDGVTLTEFSFKNDSIALDMQHVTLDWRALRLFTGTLYIRNFSAENIVFTTFESDPSESEDEPEPLTLDQFALDNSWLNVVIEKINLENIHLEPSGETLNHIRGTLILNEQGLRVRQFEIDHPHLTLQAQANIGPSFSPPIKIAIKEKWTPNNEKVVLGETLVTGDLALLQAKQIFKEGLNAHLEITAQDIGPYFKIKSQGRTDINDLKAFQPNLAGAMHLLLDLEYNHTTGSGHAKLNSTNSSLNGKPFVLNFNGRIQDYAVHWQDSRAMLGTNALTTSGQYGPDSAQIAFDIKAPALNEIIHDLPANLAFKGLYQKEGEKWSQNGNLTLSAYDTTVSSVFQISSLHDKTLDIAVKSLSLGFPDQSVYRLNQAVKIKASNDSVTIDPTACLVGPNNSSLCANNIDDSTIAMRVSRLPQSLIARFFTPRFVIKGDINAQGELTFENMRLNTLNLKTTLSPTQVLRSRRQQSAFFELGGTQLNFDLTPEKLTSSGIIHFIGEDAFDWDIQVTDWKDLTLADVQADFNGRLQNLSPLRLFITETNDFAGKLRLDLQAKGKVLSPTYTGALSIKEARLAIPSQGLILENGQFNISPSLTKNQLDITGSLKSGEGTLTLNGILELKDTWPSLDLSLRGERFRLSNTDQALVYASPQLQIKTQQKTINVTGELHIPEAALNLKGYQSYIAPSPDIILIQDNRKIQSALIDLNTRVLLTLGDNITLKASHFNTGIQGKLNIVQQSDAPTRATGQLSAVKAEYAAYGQKLAISPAIITFNNSPLDNPTLFIEASREVQVVQSSGSQYMFTDPTPQIQGNTIVDGKVGIRVTGTVQNPKYTFFSTPSMSEVDQLSYLLTGSPSTQVGAAQAAFMLGALTESTGLLGVSDTDASRLKGIGKSLALDLNIESGKHIDSTSGEAVNDTNLVVGKALRPRLYVSYTVGLLDPLSTFRVRYQLSRHWALQSQTNTQGDAGADILYGLETDGFLGID